MDATLEKRLIVNAERAPTTTTDAAARLLGVVARRQSAAAFAARALNAVATLAERIDEASLANAAGATSDYATLALVLERPEALADLRFRDPLAPARLRGLRAQDWLLNAEGGALTASQVADLLGISRQAVDKRRRQGTLIGLDLGRRGYAYPSWQFGSRGILPGLGDVLAALPSDGPWAQAAFLLTTNVWLDGETPLTALRRGEMARVTQAALHLGDQLAV